MRSSITLKKDMPGCPAGTVFTLDPVGNYRDPSGQHWLSPRAVDETPDLVEPLPEEIGSLYHYVDDVGDIVASRWLESRRDRARLAAGNHFRNEAAAKAAARRSAAALGGRREGLEG